MHGRAIALFLLIAVAALSTAHFTGEHWLQLTYASNSNLSGELPVLAGKLWGV